MLRVLITFLLAASSALVLAEEEKYLNIYIWEEYIDPEVIEQFEQRYDISVVSTYYSSDLERDQRVAVSGGEGFDLLLIDISSLQSYIRNRWLSPLEREKIPNQRYLDYSSSNITEEQQRYAQPYAEGSYGIIYRSDLVDQPVESLASLYEPTGVFIEKVALTGQATELMPSVLLYLGFDLQAPTAAQVQMAADLLLELRPQVALFSSDTTRLKKAFLDGQVNIAQGYSSDLPEMQELVPSLRYVLPKEGGFYWIDSLAVSAASESREAAHLFLDFLLEPEIAAAQMVYNNSLLSHSVAIEKLTPEIRSSLMTTRDEARSLRRFDDSNIWLLRKVMSVWHSLDTGEARE